MQREYQLIYIFVMQEMGYSNPTAVYSNTLKKIQTKKTNSYIDRIFIDLLSAPQLN